jgi:hypothetical protein
MGMLCALLCVACSAPPPLTHDAYVWQRQWTRTVRVAMTATADLVGHWRVLAAQVGPDGSVRSFALDAAAIHASARPVILVIRLDGRMPTWNEDALLAEVATVRARWRDIEIDHDAGTAQLPAYAHFLGRLHAELGATRLSITVLPAWLDAPALTDILQHVDEAVLQVHAVQSPREGLFDASRAHAWIARMAERSDKPFRVALPTYGSRVSWDDQGQVLTVESEASTLAGSAPGDELAATPTEIAAFLRELDAERPAKLAGIVWFRLPTGEDRRAWSLPTFRAVLLGGSLATSLQAVAQAADIPGAVDIVLHNDGGIDAGLPASVALPIDCASADGINGYAVRRDAHGPVLIRTQPGWLRAHHQRNIGWARCANDKVSLHVQT